MAGWKSAPLVEQPENGWESAPLVGETPPTPQQPNTWADVAKSIPSGLARGVAGLAGLPGDVSRLADAGLNKAFSYVMPETMARANEAKETYGKISPANTSADNVRRIESVTGPLYKPQTTAGKYANTISEFVPGAAIGGGSAVSKGLVALGAGGGSELAGQMTEGTSAEPWARMGGALAGGMLPNVIKRGIVPFEPNADYRSKVDTLRQAGVNDLTAGEATGSRFLKFAESHANDLPFSGGGVLKKNQASADQFNAAVMKYAGSPARDVSTKSLNNMFNDLGNQFNNLISQTRQIPIRSRELRLINRIADDYNLNSAAPIKRIDELRQRITAIAMPGSPTPGVLPADVYQNWRSQIGQLARGTEDHVTKKALYDIQNVLDSAVGRTLNNQALRDAWKKTRRQYANAKIIERAADPSTSNISPSKLASAIEVLRGQNAAKRGLTDLSELAYAGKEVMRPMPNSGTPARQAVDRFFNAPAQMVAGALGGAGATVGGVVGGVTGFAGPGLLARGTILSGPGQRWLGAAGRTGPQFESGLRGLAMAPSVSEAVDALPAEEQKRARLSFMRRELAKRLMR